MNQHKKYRILKNQYGHFCVVSVYPNGWANERFYRDSGVYVDFFHNLVDAQMAIKKRRKDESLPGANWTIIEEL